MTIEDRQNAPVDTGGDGSLAPTDTGAPVAAEGSDAPQPQTPAAPISYEAETEARGMGWVPETEWRGSKDAWRPADEFVKRGKEVLPIVRSQLDREKRKVADLEAKIDTLPGEIEAKYAARFARLEKMNAVALQKQADQIYQSFEDKKRQAVESADQAAYDKAAEGQRKALVDLQSGYDEPAEEPPQRQPVQPQRAAQMPQEVSDWIGQNSSWFNRDTVLTATASAIHAQLLKDAPGMPLDQNLRKVGDELRKRFPEKFGIEPQRQAHSPAVEGGGRQPAATGRARGWGELPPEAKQAGEKFVSQGLFGEDPKKAREEYAKDYWSQE